MLILKKQKGWFSFEMLMRMNYLLIFLILMIIVL